MLKITLRIKKIKQKTESGQHENGQYDDDGPERFVPASGGFAGAVGISHFLLFLFLTIYLYAE